MKTIRGEKYRVIEFFLSLTLTLEFAFSAYAAVPAAINYQGYLTNASGTPIDGTVSMSFRIYNISTGGGALWTETQSGVAVSKGVYSVQLGSVNPFGSLAFDQQYYLGVQVGSDPEMLPRQALTSSPYSIRAGQADDADTVDGQHASAFSASGHTHTETDPTVNALGKATLSCTNGQIAKYSGSVWACSSDIGITTESDPEVGGNTTNYVPKWDGSALVTGSIFDNGNIGIGTANTTHKLNLAGSDNALHLEGAQGYYQYGGRLNFGDGNYVYLQEDEDDSLSIYAAGRLALNGGNVGIGTATPTSKLTVAGTIEAASGGIKFPDGTAQTTASSPTWHQTLPTAERFKLAMGDQAVLDKETGVVWQRSPDSIKRYWIEARYDCYNLNLGGRKGWRLPTAEELSSLVDPSQSNPALPAGHPFTNVQSYWYWTSTAVSCDHSSRWATNFSTGDGGFMDGDLIDLYIWCVRSAQ